MADLPTNYYDDILSASMNGKKKFRLTYRNGTTEEVTIEDISEYDQYGSKFGAGDINKTNQAVNEKFDAEDVVDPMLTTEKGFAADAFLTGKALKEQEDNLTASNGMPFRFGINEDGEYGYLVTEGEGADTFVPFSGKWKKNIIDSLANTNLGLTYESTWPEIAAGIATLFPETLNLLSVWGVSSINKQGDASYTSPEFEITHFNKLTVTCGYGQTGGGGSYSCNLVTTSGTVSLLGTKTIDVSSYTGDAYITIRTTSQSMSGWDPNKPYDEWGENNSHWTSSGYVNLTKLLLQV